MDTRMSILRTGNYEINLTSRQRQPLFRLSYYGNVYAPSRADSKAVKGFLSFSSEEEIE